jgi:hypothetical protein
MMRYLFTCFVLCLSAFNCDAATDNLNSDDTLLEIAHSAQWLSLLHVKDPTNLSELHSFVDDNTFFLAGDGSINPKSELLATLVALKTKPFIQCKFPARTQLLLKKINSLAENIPPAECTEYLAWRSQLNTHSVVLVFADTQLNSPSSMYGHTFLRFDPENVEDNSTYLSYALNFGATVPEGDGGFFYAARGIAGGYPGNFAANPYFEKIKEYNQLENRDLWEYKLNLTASEIDLMLSHMWELKEIDFDYYFFDENCSFRLLELLDVARTGLNLIADFPVTSIPLDTIRSVQNAGLVIDVHYRPSIMTELKAQLANLSSQENNLVLALSKDIDVLKNDEFMQLSKAKQALVIDNAYRFLRYENTFNGRNKAVTRRSFLLMKELNKNVNKINIPIIEPVRPDLGHKTTMWSIGTGSQNEQAYAQLQYRGSYHDLLDPIDGYYSGMSLNMVNVVLRAYEGDGIALEKAELLDIVSLSNRNEFFNPWSWKANVSLEQQWTGDKEVLVTQGTGGGGVSYEPINNSHLFLLVTGRIEFNHKFDDMVSIAPGVHSGFLYNWRYTTLLMEVEYYQFLFDQTQRTVISIQQSIKITDNDSINFSAKHHKVNDKITFGYEYQEYGLEYRHYF